MSPETQTIILVVLGLVAALGPLLTLIGTITTALPALTTAFGASMGPIGLVIGIVTALIAIGVLLYKNWDTIKEKSVEIWENIKKVFGEAMEDIKSKLSTAWEWIKDFSKSFVKGGILGIVNDYILKPFLGIDLFEIGKNIIRGLIDGIKNMVGAVGEAISNVAKTVTGGISKALGIKSPSKVLMEMGEYTGEGYVLGIKAKIGDIRKQSNEMASAAIPKPSVTRVADKSVDYGRMAAEIGESVYWGIVEAIKAAGGKEMVLAIDGTPFARVIVPFLGSEYERLGVTA